MKKIEFEFNVGDKVKFVNNPNIIGFVIGLYYTKNQCKYEVEYFLDNHLYSSYFFDFEITDNINDNKMGFNT